MSDDPLRVQIGVRTKALVDREAIDRAIEIWVMHGRAPRGFRIDFVKWKNPRRRDRSLAVWKEERTPDGIKHARFTLRLRQLLQARPDIFRSVRAGKRVRS